jgi:WD40 repeat protein
MARFIGYIGGKMILRYSQRRRLNSSLATWLCCGFTTALALAVPIQQEPREKADREPAKHTEWKTEIEPGVCVLGKIPEFGSVGQTNSFAVSPNGRTIAFACGDGVKLWDLQKRKLERTLSRNACTHVEFTAEGRELMLLNYNSQWKPRIEVWDAIGGTEISSFDLVVESDQPNHYVQSFVPSPDGARVAVSSHNDGRFALSVWDATIGEPLFTVEDTGFVRHFAFDRGGRRLIGSDGKIRDSDTGQEVGRLPRLLFGRALQSLELNPSRNLIAALVGNKGIVLYDLDRQQTLQLEAIAGNKNFLTVALSDDGKRVAAALWGGKENEPNLIIWDVDSGKKIREFMFASGKQYHRLRFSADGEVVYGSTYVQFGPDKFDLRSDPKAVSENAGISGPPTVLAFSPSGDQIVAGSQGSLCLFETKSGMPRHQLSASNNQMFRAEFSRDGDYLMVASRYSDIGLYDVTADYKRIRSYSMGFANQQSLVDRLTGAFAGSREPSYYPMSIADARFSNDGQSIQVFGVSVSSQYRYQKWSSQSGASEAKRIFEFSKYFPKHDGAINYPQFFPECVSDDGNFFAAFEKNRVVIGDVTSGDIVNEFERPFDERPRCAFFWPDQKHLLTILEKAIEHWNLETGDLEKSVGTEPVASAVLSADGTRLAVLSGSHVTVFDTESWEKIISRKTAHSPYPSGTIALSRQGQKLCFGLADGRIELWDLQKLVK